jgi:hypothetical protein
MYHSAAALGGESSGGTAGVSASSRKIRMMGRRGEPGCEGHAIRFKPSAPARPADLPNSYHGVRPTPWPGNLRKLFSPQKIRCAAIDTFITKPTGQSHAASPTQGLGYAGIPTAIEVSYIPYTYHTLVDPWTGRQRAEREQFGSRSPTRPVGQRSAFHTEVGPWPSAPRSLREPMAV